jgi:hypothetical protein|nr:MAG TPA: hypothetical protein [Bacteriophage sp.]
MRLIDADALKEVLIKEKGFYPAMVASAIDNAPTIQMTSVETKTGEKEERGLQDNVSIKEARDMIEAVSALYKTLSFTRLESLKIARVCKDCLERIEEENQQ